MENRIYELKESTDALGNVLIRMSMDKKQDSLMVYERMKHWIDINRLIVADRLHVDDSTVEKRISRTVALTAENR